jgi:pimeloyl-ACP methyl ester carboxylesterase
MNTYVLVHGAWHGAWCWDKVVSQFLDKGHKVIAIDLPGHGNDKTPLSEISLQNYMDRICQVLDEQDEPVILVGHSLGGNSVSQVAEYRPDIIKTLVYLCALVPQIGGNGRASTRRDPSPMPLLGYNTIISGDKTYLTIKMDAIKEVFYHDCSDDDIARARTLLCPEPNPGRIFAQLNLTSGNYGRVPKIYIETLQDKTILPWYQEEMYRSIPFQKIIKINTSHSPFFSAPHELVTHLISL